MATAADVQPSKGAPITVCVGGSVEEYVHNATSRLGDLSRYPVGEIRGELCVSALWAEDV